MEKEKPILKCLYLIDKYSSLDPSDLDMEFNEFASLLIDMQEDGLIRGISPLYADDEISELDYEDVKITVRGIDYLKRIHGEIQNDILKELYNNRFKKGSTPATIRKAIFVHLKENEIEAYLKALKENKFVRTETIKVPALRNPISKKVTFSASTYLEYWIAEDGMKYLENEFQEVEKIHMPHTYYNISGNQVNIANDHATINALQNNGINVEELDRLVNTIKSLLTDSLSPEVLEVITDNVEVLQEELRKENPKKGFIKTAISGLQNARPHIADAVELTAAITSIIQFAMTAL